MNKVAEVLGYDVETTGETGSGKIGYYLTGKRGAVYALFRSVNAPASMFVVNSRGNVTALKGYGWFTDRDGELRPLN